MRRKRGGLFATTTLAFAIAFGGAHAHADPETVGMNTHLPPADSLDAAVDLGLTWVRIDFNWNIGERVNGTYDWTIFDRVINDAVARGLSVFPTIGYGPDWASISGDRDGNGTYNDVPDAAEFEEFVTAAAARYSDGRVTIWGLWNEPNLGFFEGTKDEWMTNVVAPTIAGVKAGCPSCQIAGPELAGHGEEHQDYMETFLRAHGDDIDVITHHIYKAFPEDDFLAGVTKDSYYNELDSHRVIEVGGIVLYEGPLSVREVAIAEGYESLPIWITETGEGGEPGDMALLEAQRQYYSRVLDAQGQRPWWTVTIFYELIQEAEHNWGVAQRIAPVDGTFMDNFDYKPSYTFLKDYLAGPCPDFPPDAGPDPTPDAGGVADAAPPGPDADVDAPDAGAGPPDAGADPMFEPDSGELIGDDAGIGPGADDDGGEGCACRATGGPSPTSLLLVLACVALLRRRRR